MVPQRDWIIDNLIANELKRRGHNACVRNYLNDGRTAIIAEKPDVCIVPVVRCEYTRDFVTRLKSWGVTVIARRSEAGVSRKQFEKMSETWQLDQLGRYEYKNVIDLELVWSREFADILIENGKIDRGQERIIGGITLDPYFHLDTKKDIESQREQDSKTFSELHGFDQNKKTILFSTGFVCADHPEYVLPEAKVGDPIHAELYQRDNNYRKMWVSAIRKLAQTGKYNILVRPHHGEEMSAYTVGLGVVVSNAGSAADALLNSDILVHAGSTMAVEAHLLGKPAFNFGNTSQDELIRDVSPSCETDEDLFAALETVELGKTNACISTLEDLKQHFYGEIDGKAHVRCADAVCEFSPGSKSIPKYWPKDELQDYSSDSVVKLSDCPITYCNSCKKPFQNLTGRSRVPCPHCGISVTTNIHLCG